ncbi:MULTISPECIES: hypothetical protein [unclassified Actinopolyspora]|uniref:hypothetical protein n=1 Tax=unclassified Actinopolyspora TaxID=2639451 RepID=UPI0013F66D42|nr:MULTISPECIES: hypothetical protein [unclassified Actinopolyspora]NHD18185.1 hypothetical protein [Actinopolyspora sp. BKK2]NHE77136.1 hypothetical protein [Actinopolyspora sp. BKK1]
MTEQSEQPEQPAERASRAAERYKEITALATEAAERLSERERQRAEQLEHELATERDRVEQAQQQRDQVDEGVRLRWNAAKEALWEERWMQVTQLPPPDPAAEPTSAEEAIRSVQSAYMELHEAVGQKRWSGSGFLPTGWLGRR